MKKIYHLLIITFSFLNVNAQQQLTHFKREIPVNYNFVFLAEVAQSVIFKTSNESVFLFVDKNRKTNLVDLNLKGKPLHFFVAEDTFWIVTQNSSSKYLVNKISMESFKVESSNEISIGTIGTFKEGFVFYNTRGALHKYDMVNQIETKLLDETGYVRAITDGGSELVYINTAETKYIFEDGRGFSTRNFNGLAEVSSITKNRQNYIIQVNGNEYYVLDQKGDLNAWGEFKGRFSVDNNYTIVTDSGQVSVYDLATKLKVLDLQTGFNFEFTATNIFGGQRTVSYMTPKVLANKLYLLASKNEYNYLAPLIEPFDFFLLEIDLETKQVNSISAEKLVPESRFRNLLVQDKSIFSMDDNKVISNRYALKNNEITVLFTDELSKLYSIALASGGFVTFTSEKITFWNSDRLKEPELEVPVLKKEVSGFGSLSKGQEFLWVTYRTEHELCIAKWEDNNLETIYQINKNGVENETGHLVESKNRINDESFLLVSEDDSLALYTYNYLSKVLTFKAKAEGNSLNSFEPFEVEKRGEEEFTFKLSEKVFVLKDKKLLIETAVGALNKGFLVNINNRLYLKKFEDNSLEILAEGYYDFYKNGDTYYFLSGSGFNRLNGNGTVTNLEPFSTSGYTPQMHILDNNYLICRVNNKVYLTDLKTNSTELVALPFERALGYKYFVRGNKIYGISRDTYRVYCYDINTKEFKVLKTFANNSYQSFTLYTDLVLLTDNGLTEAWKINDSSLEKVAEFRMSNNRIVELGNYGIFNLDGRKFYWSSEKQEGKFTRNDIDFSYSLRLFGQKGSIQFFEDKNSIWSFDGGNGEFKLVKKIEGNVSVVLNDGYFISFDNKYHFWKLNYEAAAVEELSSNKEISEVRSPVAYKEYLYFTAESSDYAQLFRISLTTEEVVLANESTEINFSFYPNPTSEILNISTSAENNEKFKIRVFDTSGKLLDELISAVPAKLDFSSYQTGVYLIHVSGAGQNTAYRIIKK